MIEIKFRAFQDNKMLYQNGSGVYKAKEFLNKLYEDCILMQYNGLKDNTGDEVKDIYTDDIVVMHQFLFDGNEVEKEIGGVIGWGEYGITLKQIRNEFIQEYCGYDVGQTELYLNDFYGLHEESWKVIGNIHENPKLLGET